MHDQVKRLTIPESNGREVTHIARREASDAKRLGERHDRSVNQPQAEFGETAIHFHRPRELTNGR